MAYEVQNFEDGQKLTAPQLNHMEDGIYANSANMAYEKQNFVNGQKLTAEQLNHMEAGIYANSVSSGSSGDATVVEQATPTISVSTSGLITATATQEAGLVAAGTKSATKQLTTQTAQTITPGTSDKTIASGRYLTGTQTIKGDSNLKAENIKSGVSIFGVTGSLIASSGGSSSGGLTVKTGTTTSNVIETGLSSIDYLIIQRYPVSTTGFTQGVYTASDNFMTFTYCNSVSQYVTVNLLSKSGTEFSVDAGTFTWNGADNKAFTGGTYYWYAFGTE